MRVIVCGGRDYEDRATVERELDAFHEKWPIEVLHHGGAKGADSLAAEWATDRGVPVKEHLAEWGKFGGAAGPIRNAYMLRDAKPHCVLAFPGGRGTADMIRKAERGNVPVIRCPELY